MPRTANKHRNKQQHFFGKSNVSIWERSRKCFLVYDSQILKSFEVEIEKIYGSRKFIMSLGKTNDHTWSNEFSALFPLRLLTAILYLFNCKHIITASLRNFSLSAFSPLTLLFPGINENLLHAVQYEGNKK